MTPLTHASFFSGVGGLDLGMEAAGWMSVSFSEVEPYACAILAERWPHVPNLGDITKITERGEWCDATLWTGGFPCQDLSVAGRRTGFGGERSVLAFAFLDLVERHRPRAFLLENVTGLLSSNGGRDLGRLLREVGELGYGWAYRVLDAQWFGVPQRRKRVFILAIDARRYPDPNSAGQILAIGTRCGRDHAAERKAWSQASRSVGTGVGIDVHGAPSDAVGMRAAHGVAGRVDHRRDLAAETGIVTALSKSLGEGGPDAAHAQAGWMTIGIEGGEEALLPNGIDRHRYRAIGNGVVAPVAEWIGRRLAAWMKA